MAKTKKRMEKLEDRFFKITENLFRELDQDSIMAEVEALQQEKPTASREKLAKELINRTARKTAMVGATAGVPGGAFGLLAAAPDIFNLVRSQSRLVLSIAFLYEQKPGLEERFKEVMAVLALSTGASATRQGVRYLIEKGLTGKTAEAIMKKIAGRYMARKIPAIAPVVGSVAGAGLNYMAVQATGKVAIEYYSSELEQKKEAEKKRALASKASGKAESGSKGSAVKKMAKTSGTKRSSSKASTKKTSSKTSATKKASKKSSKKTTKTSAKKRSPKTQPKPSEGES